MFNPEALLGQLMGDALSGQLGGRKRKKHRSSGLGGLLGGSSGGFSGATKAKLGLGLLGIAVAAYQHYQQPSGGAAAPNPLAGGAVPPPPPGPVASPPPPPPPAAPSPARTEQAMHLLRAMITAAHADGLIDAGEREAILGRAREAGLDAESLQALDAEIRAPFTVEQLVARTPASLRAEVYAAALIAITADTEAERSFLDRLATQLSLDEAARRDIHAQLGLD
ncbi:DUF533 domain-containing protein [Arenimonas terrae]|jgi:uncharacterized membrane protein YebE (DUF533 family)|uniref:DUF533 domain-containing protein n=1 Tax=Arenimonas terrae TaxID=2546226 RepID=A0A5C4RX97_9GAMM|nr:DUF533 domain-containing protein [Arenimonas terrae]TNJ35317.1 DUF533 domain-containing protein [Arenimonas terrae]